MSHETRTFSGLVPDILEAIPLNRLCIKFSEINVTSGNKIPIKALEFLPTDVSWDSNPEMYYTLCLVDPDAPNRENPIMAERVHWLVGNIPGNSKDMSKAETLIEYVPSCPGKGSGLHRYTFVLYEQPLKLDFSLESKVDSSKELWDLRRNFSFKKFARRYNLGEPFAVNYYLAEWDEDAQITRRKLGLEQ